MDFFDDNGSSIKLRKLPKYENVNTKHILNSERRLTARDYAVLLSETAQNSIEEMAQKANQLTVQYFGKVIQLYTPLYISNYCVNNCVYCNFNLNTDIERVKLTADEIEKEAKLVSDKGLQHILILTGEDRNASPLEYIKDAVRILKKYFSSVSIEIYPLEEHEYKELVLEGVDGLTVYQEVYDTDIYDQIHKSGPKKDYMFRLNAPERAARAGMRTINIGSLLGLNDFRYEAFITGIHAKYLQNKFPASEVSVSIPRLQPFGGINYPAYTVTDANLVQVVTALRIFLPRIGITLSTREGMRLRDNLLPLGITKMSAGSTTVVGGRLNDRDRTGGQFDIADHRDIDEVKDMLSRKGYQPVHKDWMSL